MSSGKITRFHYLHTYQSIRYEAFYRNPLLERTFCSYEALDTKFQTRIRHTRGCYAFGSTQMMYYFYRTNHEWSQRRKVTTYQEFQGCFRRSSRRSILAHKRQSLFFLLQMALLVKVKTPCKIIINSTSRGTTGMVCMNLVRCAKDNCFQFQLLLSSSTQFILNSSLPLSRGPLI